MCCVYIGERSEKLLKSQERILELLHARSEQAIRELTEAYGGLCRGIAGRILASCEDVEEVVSDAILSVWGTIPPERPKSLAAYISRITHNHALSRLRYNRSECRDDRLLVCLEELESCIPTQGDPEAVLEGRLVTETVNAYLSNLSKTNRYIFIRRYYCMDPTKQIASRTGLTDRAVRARLIRMRSDLRECLKQEGITV